MTNVVSKMFSALNDGQIEEGNKHYHSQFSPTLYIFSVVVIVGSYAVMTFYAKGLFSYITG